MLTEPPLALYLHLPWCLKKCPYCDFNSHRAPAPERRDEQRAAYVDALLQDLSSQREWVAARTITTVFIGGGTPSLFTPAEIGRVLEAASATIGFTPDVEITMEANPGAVEHGDFRGYRAAGVNRISIGAQSFDAATLQRLGRLHGPDDIDTAVRAAQRGGFERLNLDLMHGLPGQSVALAQADIARALALEVEHLSHYQLTLEPNTVFYANPPALPDEESLADIADAAHMALQSAGFAQYEVSAWCRPGAECRHNLNYWRYGDYLGVGAGAHGKLTMTDQVLRTTRAAHPQSYKESAGRVPEREEVALVERPFEYMLNALRLIDGFHEDEFSARTGCAPAMIAAPLARAKERGLVSRIGPGHWSPTLLGRRFLNDLQGFFLTH
ncbi:MAG: radical SAM family heme chaperone HemW [Pseudomonadota bacterium]